MTITRTSSAAELVVRTRADVYRFVNERASGTGRSRLLLFAALASLFVDSWDLAGFGAGVPSVTAELALRPAQVGALTSSIGVGAVFAAIGGGYLVDRLGRMRMFVLDMVLFVISAAIGALAPNLEILLLARFLMGLGVGLDLPAALSMVAEHSRTATKRANVNQNMLWEYAALITSYLLSWVLVVVGLGAHLWRWQIAAVGLVALAIICVRLLLAEESAFWLASRGQLHAAARVIEKTYGVRVTVEVDPEPAGLGARWGYRHLFRRPFLSRTVQSTQINLFQSIVFFAIGFYLPVIVGLLFKSEALALLGTAAIDLAGVAGSMLSVLLANRVGLRWETIVGFGLEVPILVVLGLGVAGGWVPPAVGALFLAAFLVVHTFGPAQTGVSIAALSYPTELRGKGTGLSYGVGRIGAVAGFFVFPVLLAGLGLGRTVLVLAVAPLLGCLLALAIRWDPTGDESEQATTQAEGRA